MHLAMKQFQSSTLLILQSDGGWRQWVKQTGFGQNFKAKPHRRELLFFDEEFQR
jgi:hypothetical protein